MSGRRRLSSGTTWEENVGYSRGVRVGDRIFIAGTTAMGPEGLVGGNDAGAQADYIIHKIDLCLRKLDSCLEDIVKIGVYVADIAHWNDVGRVLGQRFADIRPVNTLVEAKLVGSEFLVEIEAEAIANSSRVEELLTL